MPSDEVLHDEVAAFRRIFTHEKRQRFGHGREGSDADFYEAHIAVNKLSKLFGRNFSESLEARDFRVL